MVHRGALHGHFPATPDGRVAARCAQQRGVAARWQLHEAGLTNRAIRGRVAAARLFEVLDGVFSLSPVIDLDGMRAAAILASAPRERVRDVRLAAWTAGEALGIVTPPDDLLHTISPWGGTRGGDGFRVHRTRGLERADLTWAAGFPCTGAVRTLLDCCALGLAGRELERAVGEALYLGLTSEARLPDALRRHAGHPGLREMTRLDVVRAARLRTESPLEEEVLPKLLALPVPEPTCQVWVRGMSGRRRRVDFAWIDARVLLEADGRAAHARAPTLDADRAKDNDAIAAGWLPLRVTRRQVHTAWPTFAEQLLTTLRARGGA